MVSVEEGPKVSDCDVAMGRVSRSVTEEDPIVLMCDVLDGIIVGIDSDICASSDKGTDNVFFDAAVDESNIQIAGGRFNVIRMFSADLFDKVNCARIHECFIFVCIIFFSNDDSGKT